MSKSRRVPYLDIAPKVKRHHAFTFADELISAAQSHGVFTDAFAETHLVEFPDDDESASVITPAQERYNAIADEIIDGLLDELKPQIEETFVRIAKDVLARERQRNVPK